MRRLWAKDPARFLVALKASIRRCSSVGPQEKLKVEPTRVPLGGSLFAKSVAESEAEPSNAEISRPNLPTSSEYALDSDPVVVSTRQAAAANGVSIEIYVTRCVSRSGPSHAPRFTAECSVSAATMAVAQRCSVTTMSPRSAARRALYLSLRPSSFPIQPPPELSGVNRPPSVLDELLDLAHEAAVLEGRLPSWRVWVTRCTPCGPHRDDVEFVAEVGQREVGRWRGAAIGASLCAAVAVADAHIDAVRDESSKQRLQLLRIEALRQVGEFSGAVQPMPALQTAVRRAIGGEVETSIERLPPSMSVGGTAGGFKAAVILRSRIDVKGSPEDRLCIGSGVGTSKKGAIREAAIDAVLDALAADEEQLNRVAAHPAFDRSSATVKTQDPPPSPSRQVPESFQPPIEDDSGAATPPVENSESKTPDSSEPDISTSIHPGASVEQHLQRLINGIGEALYTSHYPVTTATGEVLWRTELRSEDSVLTVTHHTSSHVSRAIAASAVMSQMFPSDSASVKDHLRLDERCAKLGGTAAALGSAGPSQLARLRRAVNEAVSDSYGDEAILLEKVTPTADGLYETLLTVGESVVVGSGSGPSELCATFRAYSAAIASSLLDSDQPTTAEASNSAVTPPQPPRPKLRASLEASLKQRPRITADLNEWLPHFAQFVYGVTLTTSAKVTGGAKDAWSVTVHTQSGTNSGKAVYTSGSSSYSGASDAAMLGAAKCLFPEATAEYFRLVTREYRIQASSAVQLSFTADGAAIQDLTKWHSVSPSDVNLTITVLSDSPMISSARVDVVLSGGLIRSHSTEFRSTPPLVALREAVSTALAELPESASLAGKEARIMVEPKPQGTGRGPLLLAVHLVARHHGLRLGFHAVKEPVQSQSVWRASAVLCCQSSSFDPRRPPQLFEIAFSAQDKGITAANLMQNTLVGEQVGAVRAGPYAWADTKKAAISKAAIRFLQSSFPVEYAAALASEPSLFALTQTEEAEREAFDHLRSTEARSGVKKRPACPDPKPRQSREEFTDARNRSKSRATPVRDDDEADMLAESVAAAANDIELPHYTRPNDAPIRSASTKGATSDAKRPALLDVLREAGRRENIDIRVSTVKMAGGWTATVTALPRNARGGFDFEHEKVLATSSNTKKEVSRLTAVYHALQDHFTEDLYGAIERDPQIVDVDAISS